MNGMREIIDNGRGFDHEQRFPGLGLRNIQTRAAEIGGTATVTSAPGTATTVRVTLTRA